MNIFYIVDNTKAWKVLIVSVTNSAQISSKTRKSTKTIQKGNFNFKTKTTLLHFRTLINLQDFETECETTLMTPSGGVNRFVFRENKLTFFEIKCNSCNAGNKLLVTLA